MSSQIDRSKNMPNHRNVSECMQYDDATLIKRGDQFFRMDQYQNAIDSYDYIPSTHPRYARVLLQKALAYKYMKREGDAIECFEELVKMDPDNIRLLYQKGLLHNHSAEAIKCFDAMFKLYDDSIDSTVLTQREIAEALYRTGYSHWGCGSHADAIECLDNALLLIDEDFSKNFSKDISKVRKRIVRQLEENSATGTKKWYNRIGF